ncbi:MAG TPA: DUF1835 domain-containing protein [Blastocatellia bacterium]|jgi:hypothetical protein|nr:DUF1835 domain-containing protein [Blastocatellia bacterium]
MLHIHNGDSTANTMKEAGFPGEHFAFREALATGPAPPGLSADEWLAARANYLAGSGGLGVEDVKKELSKTDEVLGDVSAHDEIIMWFEHDLFCQVNLIYLLNRFSNQDMGGAKLSLICVGEFAGVENFRGLGQLSAKQMASLFDTRHRVTDAETSLARRAWAAYCSPDPEIIQSILEEDTSALPYLRGALLHHLARFPSVRNGLGGAENKLLELVRNGQGEFMRLCSAFFDAEPEYGLGDVQVWRDLERMARADQPLAVIDGLDDSNSRLTPSRIHKTSFSITETGEEVLEGKADFVALNGIDLWLGGVHLNDKENLWRWDEQEQKLERFS